MFDDEVARLAAEFGDKQAASELVEQDHKLISFYLPPAARWPAILMKTTGLGDYLTTAVRARSSGRLLSTHRLDPLPQNKHTESPETFSRLAC